jgi:hypothetical protein
MLREMDVGNIYVIKSVAIGALELLKIIIRDYFLLSKFDHVCNITRRFTVVLK